MTKRSIWTKLLPPGVQDAIVKSWLPFNDGTTDTMYGAGAPSFMSTKKEELVTEGYMGNPLVYMIVGYMTRLAAQIPWTFYEVKDDKSLNRWKNLDPTDRIRYPILETKAVEPIQQHDVVDIWKRPNELQAQSEFIEQVLGYKLITGNTFIHGLAPETGPNNGLFVQLDVLPAQFIGAKYGSPMEPLAHYYWLGDPTKKIPKEYVMHSKRWNPLPYSMGGLYGLSPLQAGSRLIQRSNDSITASVKSLQNMGAVGMLSRYVGDAQDGSSLTPDQAKQIEHKYYQKFGGANNRGKIMVTGAAVKWQQMAMSPVDLKIIEQENVDLRRMCAIYGLASQLFNDPDSKTYNTYKEAKAGAYTQAVIPEMRSLRDEVNRWWIPGFEKRDNRKYWLDMDLQAIPELQTDIKQLMDWLRDADMLTPDEKRKVLDYEPLEAPGTDQLWVDGNKITMDQALQDVEAVDKYLDHLTNK